MSSTRLIIALDFPSASQALAFIKPFSPNDCKLKVGFELFVSAGADFVKTLIHEGFDVFLDLKFHDIPNTVASACRQAAELGVWMVNVHSLGGKNMLIAAQEALKEYPSPPKLIAVTVLTSMDQQQLKGLNITHSPQEQVKHLASLTQECELDGVVCSAQEADLLRKQCGNNFLLVTPGIRPLGSATGDQRRIMTPEDAIASGSDYIVVGRPITQANEPQAVVRQINQSLKKLLS